jgi:hypothetical protein
VNDDPTLYLIAELDANCAVMGAYYCGECLQCRASVELRRLIEENSILRQAAGEEGRANRMTFLYEKEKEQTERLRGIISNYIKAEQDMNHASTDYFALDYHDEMAGALKVWKDAFHALEQEALRDDIDRVGPKNN